MDDGRSGRAAALADLAGLMIFDGLADEELRWVAEHARVIELPTGEMLVHAGDAADEMFVILSGQLQFQFGVPGHSMVIRRYERGDVTGLLPYSRMTTFAGSAVAVDDAALLVLHRRDFADLVRVAPMLGQRLVAILSDRVRDATRNIDQQEKLVALGKLSAGLAHELNNPASAARRSTGALRERLHRLPGLVTRLTACGITHEQICAVNALREAAEAGAQTPIDAIDRSEREDAVGQWLERYRIDEPWIVAETLVDAGITVAQLEAMAADVPPHMISDAIGWVEGSLAADRLLTEIDEATGRISTLVASIKTYSHMDRGAEVTVTDVRDGIDSTITMLRHKLDAKSIRVERDFDPELPSIEGYPGALNQVWTNLIDNAVDAMQEGGTLRIEANPNRVGVKVVVTDTGHGVPDELRSRIFEPFFTTKDVGEGTGLGLDVVQRIVTRQHGGTIELESRPGRTAFTICLPVQPPRPVATDQGTE